MTEAATRSVPAPRTAADAEPLLEVTDLTVDYLGEQGSVRACAEVSFTLRRGEILGVAGESGSGKSTLITALTRLQRPPAVTSGGRIVYHPRDEAPVDLAELTEKQLRKRRWRQLAIVMQSAMDCLNPVMRLGTQFEDVIRQHHPELNRRRALDRAEELLRMVGISGDRLSSYPHELSGGMRQRSLIALALACDPDLVVMDEPTTAVDVVMQRQILSQVLRLQRKLGFAVVFVTHDLSLLLELADRIAIMYAGRVVEIGSSRDLFHHPKHPYTEGLRDSFPPLHEPLRELHGIPGTPPDLRTPPPGCPFHPRCAKRFGACDGEVPALIPLGRQQVACHLYGVDGPSGTDRHPGADGPSGTDTISGKENADHG